MGVSVFYLHISQRTGTLSNWPEGKKGLQSTVGRMPFNPITLKFNDERESKFLEDRFKKKAWFVRGAIVFAMLLYIAFGILDYFLFPQEVGGILKVRLGVNIPIVILGGGLSFTSYFKRYFNQIMTAMILTSAASIVYINVLIAGGGIFSVHFSGLLLAIVFCYTFSKIQFLWAAFNGIMILIGYNLAFLLWSPMTPDYLLSSNLILIAINFVGMFACYWIEFFERMDFAKEEDLKEERAKIQSINHSLETRIAERTSDLMALNRSLQAEIQTRIEAESAKTFFANYDALTHTFNRRHFTEFLQKECETEAPYFAVVYIDTDNFREINDLIGHNNGDEILKKYVERIKRFFSEKKIQITLGRMGGDEFALIVWDFGRETDLFQLLEAMLFSLSNVCVVESHKITLFSSVGVSFYPEHGESALDLLRNAEAAMTRAKESGGNRLSVFNALLADEIDDRLYLSAKLREAIAEDQLYMLYQPKISLKTGRVSGVEALMRWHLPERGNVSPDVFIPIAEATGVIHQLGEWAFKRVCSDLKQMRFKNELPFSVSVNLSAIEFNEPGIMDKLSELVENLKCRPHQLCIEITESAMMHDMNATRTRMKHFQELGIQISVDDFGTGYSSLAYLSHLPIHELKIDRSFVNRINKATEDEIIIKSIISLAKNLNLRTVSEGVETEEQLQFLLEQQVDEIQGFYFSKPLTVEALQSFVEDFCCKAHVESLQNMTDGHLKSYEPVV